MSRTGVRPLRIALVGLALLGGVLVGGRATGSEGPSGGPPAGTHRHLVAAGDTLWEIARTRVGAAGDPRPLVDAIEELNGLRAGGIRPGQSILIPPAP